MKKIDIAIIFERVENFSSYELQLEETKVPQ